MNNNQRMMPPNASGISISAASIAQQNQQQF